MTNPHPSTSKVGTSPGPSHSHYPSPRQTSDDESLSPPPALLCSEQPISSAFHDGNTNSDHEQVPVRRSSRTRALRPIPTPTPALSPTPNPTSPSPSPSPDPSDDYRPNKRPRPSYPSSKPTQPPKPTPAATRAAASRRANQAQAKRDRHRAVAAAIQAAVHAGRISAHTVTQGTIDSIALAATRKWDGAEERRREKEERKQAERRRKLQQEYIKRGKTEGLEEVVELGDSDEEIDLLDDDDD